MQWGTLFAQGIGTTFFTWIVSGTCSLVIGTFFGIVSCNRLATPSVKCFIKLYTFIAKGIPAYVQILIAYFIIPSLLNISLSPLWAACGALAFCSSGYVTEIIRSGINAVPSGQWDACVTLGYSLPATLKRIILPQTLKKSGPALFGECEQLLKSTCLLAAIGVTEVTRTGMNIISRELNPIPVYLAVACIYLCFSACVNLCSFFIEKKVSYGQS